MTPKLHVILNPAAGARRDLPDRLRLILDRGDAPYVLRLTARPGDAGRLAREAISAGAGRLGVCGGDGTVAQVAHALAGSGIPLGLLPCGSGNFLARALGVPRRLEAAAALLSGPRPTLRRLDLGLLNDQPFLVRASIGFEAAVIAQTPPESKRRVGVFGYGIGGLRALIRLRRLRFRVTIDGAATNLFGDARAQQSSAPTQANFRMGTTEVRGLNLFVANTPGIGRLGLVLPGGALPDDGLLDALTLDLVPGALLGFAAGALHLRADPRSVWHRRTRALRITVDSPQIAHADGELLRAADFAVTVRPAAVTVIVPG